jgi:hypothetical protein
VEKVSDVSEENSVSIFSAKVMRADETMFCIGKSGQGSHCMDNRDGPFKG